MKEKLKKAEIPTIVGFSVFLIDKQGSIDYNSAVGSHNIN